jgi:CRP/FNR family cyclic AMP-dependent transcriptional regulator
MTPRAPSAPHDLRQHLPLLQRGHWFAALPAEFAAALMGLARLRSLQPGEALFLRGDPPCGLYAVTRGALRISGQSGDAHRAEEAVLMRLEPGAWFGEIGVFDGAPRAHHVHAIEATSLLQIPQAELQDWLRAHPPHWQTLGLLMAEKLRLALITLEEHNLLSARQRVIKRLLLMAQGWAPPTGDSPARPRSAALSPPTHWNRNVKLSQGELARMVGISRQTTNEILNALKAEGLLQIRRSEITIENLAALRQALEPPPPR